MTRHPDFRQFDIPAIKTIPAHMKTINTDKAFSFRWLRMNNRIKGAA